MKDFLNNNINNKQEVMEFSRQVKIKVKSVDNNI